MITDSQINKLSLVMAVIGLIGIAVLNEVSKPSELNIAEITEEKLGKIVQISGAISSYSSKDGHVFLDIYDGTEKIKVVMFERTARNHKEVYNLSKGENVTVIGKILLYKSEIEIQADNIKRI